MKRNSVQTRLKNLTHETSLLPDAKERIRRNLDQEIEAFSKQKVIQSSSSIKRRLATTLSMVAPLLLLVVGYSLWNNLHIDTSTNNRHVTPIAPTVLVTPSVMPSDVSNVPTVTLNYTDHSHYQYTLAYKGQFAGTRFVIQEGSMFPINFKASPQVTWTVQDVAVQVYQPEQSQLYALFSYAGRHYTVITSESTLNDAKVVVTSLVGSAINRG